MQIKVLRIAAWHVVFAAKIKIAKVVKKIIAKTEGTAKTIIVVNKEFGRLLGV